MSRSTPRIVVTGFAVLAVAGMLACGSPATRASASAPTVVVASVNGTGCPAGTVTTAVAPDASSVTAAYSAFTARAGAGSTPTEFRRVCVLSIQIVSPGQTWAVTSATEHGAIDIPTGATALQRSNYYLQGSTGTPVDHSVTGPQSGAWDQSDAAPITAPCGTVRNLNVSVELRVTTAGGVAASLSLNGTDPGTTVNLGYTACP
jgi:hypothetical protein